MVGVDRTAQMARNPALLAGALVVLAGILMLLGRFGVSDEALGGLLVAGTAAAFLALAIGARTMDAAEFYVARRAVPPLANSAATAAAFVSGWTYLGLAGAFFRDAQSAMALTIGWSLGFLLLAVMFAPYVWRSGAIGVADFLAIRFGSRLVRLAAAVVLALALFAALAAAFAAATFAAGAAFGLPAGRDADRRGGVGARRDGARRHARRHRRGHRRSTSWRPRLGGCPRRSSGATFSGCRSRQFAFGSAPTVRRRPRRRHRRSTRRTAAGYAARVRAVRRVRRRRHGHHSRGGRRGLSPPRHAKRHGRGRSDRAPLGRLGAAASCWSSR